MINKKMLLTLCAISLSIFFAIAASQVSRPKERNLKVLPKDISDQMLDSIMGSYNKALGVNCNFCHAEAKSVFPNQYAPGTLDLASDKNEMKEQARRMMRLTIEINKNFFYYDTTKRPEYLNIIHCKTCHQGEVFPPAE